MKSGGTRQVVLVAAALAASGVLAAWWWSAQRSDAATMPEKPARAEVVNRGVEVAAPGSAAIAVEKSPAMSAPAATVSPKAEPETKPALPPVGSAASDSNARSLDLKSHEHAVADEAKSPLPASDEAAIDGAKRDASEAEIESASKTNEHDAETADPGSMESTIDTDKAAELIARYLADLDSGEHANSEDARIQHEFDAREGGSDDERRVEETLRKGIVDWIGTLSASEAGGLALMSVECRVGQCRILMAQAHYGGGPGTAPEDQERQVKLMAAFGALAAEPWWQALGLQSGRSVSFPAVDGSGMGLWVEYENLTNALGASAEGG